MNLRVGMIVYNPYGASLGYSIRPRELSINLAKQGCEVFVFSPVDENSQVAENLFVKGIPVWQVLFTAKLHESLRKTFKSKFVAKYLYNKRVLEALSERLAEGLYSKIKACKVDVLQGETEIASMAAVKLGKRLGIPAVADIHGLLVEEAIQYGFLKNGTKECRGIRAFATTILHESSSVLVVSEKMRDFLAMDYGVNTSKIFIIPNAATPRDIIRPARYTMRNFVYAGILEPWERVDLAIASVPYIHRDYGKARFLIAGNGSLMGFLVRLTDDFGVKNWVDFKGAIPYSRIADFLAQGDVAVLPSTIDIVRKVACPIKLFDYLAAGLPVVTVEGLWWSDFVRQNNIGIVAKDNPESFGEAVCELLSNPDLTNVMSSNAVQLIKNEYNWAEMSKKVLQVYERIL